MSDSQLSQVHSFMNDGQWKTLAQVATQTNTTQQNAARLLRRLREPKNGGYLVHLRRTKSGSEYRVEGSDLELDAEELCLTMIEMRWLIESLMFDSKVTTTSEWDQTYKSTKLKTAEVTAAVFP